MNQNIIQMLQPCFANCYDVLFLTNAMQPLVRARGKQGFLELLSELRDKLTLRISLDHFHKK